MRQIFFSLSTIAVFFTFLLINSCKKEPYIVEYKNIKGYIIGKETCNTDEIKDYWMIDFTYGTNNPKIGDTLFFNGISYNNVLKATGLDPQLKTVGLRISIDYNSISPNKVTTTGCSVATPLTYHLKEVTIKNQGEIR